MSAVLSDPVTAKTVSCCRCMDSFLQRDMLCGTQTPAQDLLRDRRWALARSTPCLLFLMTSMGYSDRPWNSSCLQAERSAAGAGKSLSREPGADIMSFCARMEATPSLFKGLSDGVQAGRECLTWSVQTKRRLTPRAATLGTISSLSKTLSCADLLFMLLARCLSRAIKPRMAVGAGLPSSVAAGSRSSLQGT